MQFDGVITESDPWRLIYCGKKPGVYFIFAVNTQQPQWVELAEQRNIESICYSIKSILALSRHTKFWVRSRSDRVKIIINRNNYFQNITIFWYYLYANDH
jgi:hypothetical protein